MFGQIMKKTPILGVNVHR